MRIDEGTIDDELKLGKRLGQCIWDEIKWSTKTKSRENKIGEPINLKYPTTVNIKGNVDGDQWGNNKQRIEIKREITTMYLGWNQMVRKDEIERKWKRNRDEKEVKEEIGGKRKMTTI